MLKKLIKNKKGSELIEKILKVAVSLSIGAVIIGTTWGIVDHYVNAQAPGYQEGFKSDNGNGSSIIQKYKTLDERYKIDIDENGLFEPSDFGAFIMGCVLGDDVVEGSPKYVLEDILGNEIRIDGLTLTSSGDHIFYEAWDRYDLNNDGILGQIETAIANEYWGNPLGSSITAPEGTTLFDSFVQLYYEVSSMHGDKYNKDFELIFNEMPKEYFPRPDNFPF